MEAVKIMGDVAKTMSAILLGLSTVLFALLSSLTPSKTSKSIWLACPEKYPAQREWEIFNLVYAVFWVGCFAVIIAFRLYETFDEMRYLLVLAGLCFPIVLFPLVRVHPKEVQLSIGQRFGVRANAWIAVYSFIGNYWYTHYFYCVLRARYTFPSWRLNDVPIPLYFATFFYFCMYHALSNTIIRKVVTSFEAGVGQTVALIVLVCVMAYTTAFMETLTISGFPYYLFEDRDKAYIFGSAFYGIYFIVSFPMFFMFGERTGKASTRTDCTNNQERSPAPQSWDAIVNAMGCSMAILILLDIVRLTLGEPLVIKG